MAEVCRCGHSGGGSHPCHGRLYTCRQPASHRFYNASYVSLSGTQMKVKVQMKDTWACDDCWEAFERILRSRGQPT